jgi:hypothetical protein
VSVFNDGLKKRDNKRGETNNAARLAGLGKANDKGGVRVDWGDAHPDNLSAVVLGVTRLGGLVSFGLSRDKGAYSLTIMLDGERAQMWFNGDAEIDTELEKVVAYLDTLT